MKKIVFFVLLIYTSIALSGCSIDEKLRSAFSGIGWGKTPLLKSYQPNLQANRFLYSSIDDINTQKCFEVHQRNQTSNQVYTNSKNTSKSKKGSNNGQSLIGIASNNNDKVQSPIKISIASSPNIIVSPNSKKSTMNSLGKTKDIKPINKKEQVDETSQTQDSSTGVVFKAYANATNLPATISSKTVEQKNFFSRVSGIFKNFHFRQNVKPSSSDSKHCSIVCQDIKDHKNLILRYGVLDSFGPNYICNPKYFSVANNSYALKKESEKLVFHTCNIDYVKSKLNHRVSEITYNILSLHNRHSILTDPQLKLLYDISIVKESASISTSLSNLKILDDIVQSIPILVPNNVTVTSHFGPRVYNKCFQMHAGVDLVHQNKKIYACASGIVNFVGKQGLYGNLVTIQHLNCNTRYAHLAKYFVKVGDIVRQGDLIGIEGSTGRTTGRHLHLEVRIKDRPVDPVDFIQYSLGKDYKVQRIERFAKYHRYIAKLHKKGIDVRNNKLFKTVSSYTQDNTHYKFVNPSVTRSSSAVNIKNMKNIPLRKVVNKNFIPIAHRHDKK